MNIKRMLKAFVVTSVGTVLTVWVAYSQAAPEPRRTPNYDPATEVTVKGGVERVNNISGPRRWGGTHLTLKTDSGTLDIHAAPAFFIKDHDFSFAAGDQIEVTGSKIKYQGIDAIIAREIRKDGKILTLRDAQGLPAWSRGRGRP